MANMYGAEWNLRGIRYHATGVFGYSFRQGEIELSRISNSVLPNPDIYLFGYMQESLVHKHYDSNLTRIPGVRRTVVDKIGNVCGYYEYISQNTYRIVVNNESLHVFVYEDHWEIYTDIVLVATIYQIPENQRVRFVETGYDMEEWYKLTVTPGVNWSFYPYISAIPILGF